MKCFYTKLLEVFFIYGVICAAKNSSKIVDTVQKVDDEESFNLNFKNQSVNNSYMYSYKTSGQSQNYLNYRARYGLRYKQAQKKPTKVHTSENLIHNNYYQKPIFNGTISNEVISANEDETQNTNDKYELDSNFESETVSHGETVMSAENADSVRLLNYTYEDTETAADESRKHIMRPNNRVEQSLDFLAERLKKLIFFSQDKNRPESKISPHLSSLGKFLNLFSLIKLENVPCLSGQRPLRQLSGTCYTEVDCLNLGGLAVGHCVNGLGVCCVFKGGCNSVSNQNVTYFESPNFPGASRKDLGTCTLTLLLPRNVKQVLVEFMFFEVLPPTDGDCLDDRFFVAGQAMNFLIPDICGIATGQHMFLDVDGSDKIQLSLATKSADDRAFSIKVTQLRDNDLLSPQGCFQYYTSSEGFIKTFNYDDYSQLQVKRNPGYFNNINYSICIRRKSEYCRITYSNELQGREDVFELINIDDDGNVIPGPGQAGAEIFSCQDDFIAVNYIRVCGSKLNDGSVSGNFNLNVPVQSYMSGPIILPFKTNNNTVGRGFRIYYYQDKCTP